MPKKIRFESFKYRFLIEANLLRARPRQANAESWEEFVDRLNFVRNGKNVQIAWGADDDQSLHADVTDLALYSRYNKSGCELPITIDDEFDGRDNPMVYNQFIMARLARMLATKAGYKFEDI